LKFLDVSGNQINSLVHLHTPAHEGDFNKFENLELLVLASNLITSGNANLFNGLVYLQEMEKLDVLDLNDNKLTAIPPLKYGKMYKYVNLTQNHIADLQGRPHVATGNNVFLIKPQRNEQSGSSAPAALVLSNIQPHNGK
jgi:Leucine-rich repeat (LRR) protein